MSSTVSRKQSKTPATKGKVQSKSPAKGKKRSASRFEAEQAKQLQAFANQLSRALGLF